MTPKLLTSLLLVGISSASNTVSIKKGILDKKEYRHIILENEVQALLISDRETKTASVVAHMGVGSADEPDDIPGLAHLLEHMLIRGSKAFPNIDDFGEFVANCEGFKNATTYTNFTELRVHVPSSYLEGALQRISQCLIAPLLSPEVLDHEIEIVSSEYDGKKNINIWQLLRINQLISRQNHLFSRFTEGNIRTLKEDPETNGINVHRRLVEFFEKKFSSHKLKIVLHGDQTLDQLEQLIVKYFNDVKKNEDNRSYILSDPPYSFESGLGPKIVQVESNTFWQSLVWQISSPDVYTDSLRFLFALLKDCTENGLQSNLVKEEETFCLPDYSFEFGHYIFFIASFKPNSRTLSMVLAYFKFLKNADLTEISKLYESKRKMAEFNFEVGEVGNPLVWIREIANEWSEGIVSLPNILRANIPGQFNSDSFIKLLDHLLGNEFFFIQTVSGSIPNETRILDSICNLSFSVEYGAPSLYLRPLFKSPKYSLPTINQFIPESFEKKHDDKDRGFFRIAKDNFFVNFIQRFGKSSLLVKICLDKSVDAEFITRFAESFVSKIEKERKLKESCVKFDLSVTSVNDDPYLGLTLRFEGFDDKLFLAVDFINDEFFKFKPKWNVERVKCNFDENYNLYQPYQIVTSNMYEILQKADYERNYLTIQRGTENLEELISKNIRKLTIFCEGNFYSREIIEASFKLKTRFPVVSQDVANLETNIRQISTVNWKFNEIVFISPERSGTNDCAIAFFLNVDRNNKNIEELAGKIVAKYQREFFKLRDMLRCYHVDMVFMKNQYCCGIRFYLQSIKSPIQMENVIEEFIATVSSEFKKNHANSNPEDTKAMLKFIEDYMVRGGQKRKKLSIYVFSAKFEPETIFIPGSTLIYNADEVVEILSGYLE